MDAISVVVFALIGLACGGLYLLISVLIGRSFSRTRSEELAEKYHHTLPPPGSGDGI